MWIWRQYPAIRRQELSPNHIDFVNMYRYITSCTTSVKMYYLLLQRFLYTNSEYIFFFHWLYSPLGPRPLFFSFMIILQMVGLLGRVISSSQDLYINTGQQRHRINTYTHHTSMPYVGFEPTIPASERAKTAHVLDRSATVTGSSYLFIYTLFKTITVVIIYLSR
jgi:hypothetical protein